MSTLPDLYQRQAETLLKASVEMGDAHPHCKDLVVLAARQLEDAADTIQMLKAALDVSQKPTMSEGEIMRRAPAMGEWDRDREAALRRARRQGFLLGFSAAAIAIALMVWVAG